MGNCCKIFKGKKKNAGEDCNGQDDNDIYLEESHIEVVDLKGNVVKYLPKRKETVWAGANDTMSFVAETLDCKSVSFEVTGDRKIETLKNEIQEKLGLLHFDLLYNGTVMPDTSQVLNYEIVDGSVVDILEYPRL